MPSSPLERYNSPTCTLEIRKKTAPWWAWLRENKLENIYFELYFNDPRSSQTEKIIICGDREKLQQLCIAVKDYVQQFLALTPRSLSLKAEKATVNANSYAPSLQPKNLLAHQLFLGSLATEKSAKQIELSPLQLFDLATALEKYSANLAAIEPYGGGQKAKLTPPWKTSLAAATIALLALGTIATRLLNPPTPLTQTISSSTKEETESLDRSFEVLPPPPPQNPPQTKPSLNNTETTTAPPAASELPQTNPTPPRSTTITPEKKTTRRSPQISRQVNPELPPLPSLAAKDADLRDSRGKDSVAVNQSSRENNTTAILAEVNNYLKQRWQPPKDLERSLEYRLIVDRNGSLDRVIPLGYPSQIYRDRTGIPSEGETLVSSFSTSDKLTIRVFLIQDGSVKTFLE